MENIKMIQVPIKGIVYYLNTTGQFIIASSGKGGAIVKGSDLAEAKQKFEMSIKIYYASLNLKLIKELIESADSINDESPKAVNTEDIQFEYEPQLQY